MPAGQIEDLLSKRKQRRAEAESTSATPAESPSSKGVTVFWMTSLLATVLSQIVALALRLLLLLGSAPPLLLLSNVMQLVAVVTGVVCLLVTPIVYRVRDTPPPRAITQFAVVAGLLPIVVLIVLLAWPN
jgi:hypothetical protein